MEYRTEIGKIRGRFQRGEITIEQAEAEVKPLLEEMNAKGAKIAKEHGRSYKKLTFGYVFR